MSLRITSRNNPALSQLQQNNSLADSIQRLSSGRQINRAADNSAGLLIADTLASEQRGMGQAIRNATDAISITQVAAGALSGAGDIVQRIRSLSLQAAQGSNSQQSRNALQAEINNSLAALDNIGRSTTYNGQRLLDGTFTNRTFQTGTAGGGAVSLSIPALSSTTLGDGEQGTLATIDVTTQSGAENAVAIADGALEQINSSRAELGSRQNQLASTISNLSTTSVNLAAAQSQTMDIDLAEESMILAKSKLLTKAQTFAAAQAGKNDEKNVLSLLQG